MKRLLLTALLACIGSAALAQTSQGSVVASGSLSYQNTTFKSDAVTDKTGNRSFNIAPSIGYMLRDGLEAGMSVGYTSSIEESKGYRVLPDGSHQLYSSGESTEHSFAIGPYLKKYFSVSEKIAFTGQAYVNYVSTERESYSEYTSGRSESYSGATGIRVGVKPGITFFPTTKIGLSASFGNLGYTRNTSKSKLFDDHKSTSSNFGLDLSGNTLSFGFGYYISR